ncbi:MAG: 50S ribosomal protein L21 [Bacteroidota bacterium]|nr:50S ribosomal protein L21 [Bacteroidota bacterium]
MYAIVTIAGKQFKVTESQRLTVPLLPHEVGEQVTFTDVHLLSKDGSVVVGTPSIENALITARVLEHFKAEKVLVFKKKRRKGYKKLTGHRQRYTHIEIESIKN